MSIWRMAMRCGNCGPSIFEQCRKRGLAAISYEAVDMIDLSEYSEDNLPEEWQELTGSASASLRNLAYRMCPGDIIFVKHGCQIVGRGVVTGSYCYLADKFVDEYDNWWSHVVPVKWDTDAEFLPVEILLGAEQHTILKLDGERLSKLEAAIKPYPGKYSLYEEEKVITERCKGQGYNLNSVERRAVEQYAMKGAIRHFRKAGYAVQDTSANRPYDLVCKLKKETWYVEVKGTTGQPNTVFLTKNEVLHAKKHPAHTILFILYDIQLIKKRLKTSGGKEYLLKPWCPEDKDLEALEYRYNVPSE